MKKYLPSLYFKVSLGCIVLYFCLIRKLSVFDVSDIHGTASSRKDSAKVTPPEHFHSNLTPPPPENDSASPLSSKNDAVTPFTETDKKESKLENSDFASAVFLQVGYDDLWDELYQCAKNVVIAANMESYRNVDVFVSVVAAQRPDDEESKETDTKEVKAKIESDLNALANIGEVVVQEFENEGADIGSFLKMLNYNSIADRNYSAVLKLHTKGDDLWRERAIESLCGTPRQVLSILSTFKTDSDLDMVAPQGTVFGPDTDPSDIFPHIVNKYSITEPPKATFDVGTVGLMTKVHKMMFPNDSNREIRESEMLIAAGTMFWARYFALNPQELVRALPKFDFNKGYVENLGIEHALERMFATEIAMSGRKIAEIAPAPLPVAMYFPQFHPFPENDRFWGKGFTEWTLLKPLDLPNIRKPLPVEEGGLGFYDLMSKETRRRQTELAKSAGLNGFIYYHYWFSGSHAPENHLVMDQVHEQLLIDGEPNLPFAFSWINEPWTGISENDKETLLSQEYGDEAEWTEHFEYLLKFFKHPNYIRVHGKPVFILYRIGHIDSKLEPMVKLWRKLALEAGLPGLHIVNTIGNFRLEDEKTAEIEKAAGLDAAFHFWPQLLGSALGPDHLSSDTASATDIESLQETYPTQYWGSFTGFDRRPRDNNAQYLYHRSVQQFDKGLECSFQGMSSKNSRVIDKNLYFLTAWNEWNEQAVLEPDNEYGFGYLNTLDSRLRSVPVSLVFPPHERDANSFFRSELMDRCKTSTFTSMATKAIGEPSPDTRSPPEKMEKLRISLVISHCDHSLAWLKDYVGKEGQIDDITIVSKCDKVVEGVSDLSKLSSDIKITRLPNVGRCDHTFAYWIVNNYSKMKADGDGENLVAFLKDNDYMESKFKSFHDVMTSASDDGIGCVMRPDRFAYGSNALIYHNKTVMDDFGLPNYQRLSRDSGDNFQSENYPILSAWTEDMGLIFPDSDIVPVCYGGLFVSKKVGILKQSLQTWKKMEKSLTRADNLIEGHFAERSWASITFPAEEDENLKKLQKDLLPHIGKVEDTKDEDTVSENLGMLFLSEGSPPYQNLVSHHYLV